LNWFCDLVGAALAVLILAWVLSMPVWASPSGGNAGALPDWTTVYPAIVGRVIDGDTFEATVMVWPDTFVTTKVRVYGVDTPELRSRVDCERRLAEKAKSLAESLLTGGDVTLSNVIHDKYGGRHVAVVKVDGEDLAKKLIQEGLAAPYTGGTKSKTWCG
jgi:endonuclease YncB( thermonuclease family)